MSKTFLIDTSRCTACRGCQLACKEWHELPANRTFQTGSHQNPPDLNPNNYKVVRFHDYLDENGVIRWNFFPDQCRHCLIAPCKETGDMYIDNAIVQDAKTGAILYTEKTRDFSEKQFEEIRDACPYNVPRRDAKTGLLAKCTMCNDRVLNGMPPACVRACPTGAMNFGEREDMLKLAEKRLAEVKRERPGAFLADSDSVSVIYLLVDKPETYFEHAVASAAPIAPLSKQRLFAELARPFKAMKA